MVWKHARDVEEDVYQVNAQIMKHNAMESSSQRTGELIGMEVWRTTLFLFGENHCQNPFPLSEQKRK